MNFGSILRIFASANGPSYPPLRDIRLLNELARKSEKSDREIALQSRMAMIDREESSRRSIAEDLVPAESR